MSADPIDNFFSDDLKQDRKTPLARCLKLFENNEEIKDLFCFNEMSGAVEFTRIPFWNPNIKPFFKISDFDLISCRTFLTRRYNFSPTKDTIYDAIYDIASKKRYHPIKNYLNGLRWDEIPRLDNWLTSICGVEDNIYTRAVSRKILCGAVARIFEPGIKFDYLPILEGPQGKRKSLLVEKMAVDKKYYTTITFSQNDKEITENITGKWIIEVPEMQGFKKQEVERTKALLSRDTDRTRLAYGRMSGDYPRENILIGTHNPVGENKYLADTENRRFWPIYCQKTVEIRLFEDLRDQLYAEALQRYRADEKLWLDNDAVETFSKAEQSDRQIIDPWESIVEDWLALEACKLGRFTTIVEIAQKCLNIPAERLNINVTSRVGRILAKTGWQKQREAGGQRRNYYISPNAKSYEKYDLDAKHDW